MKETLHCLCMNESNTEEEGMAPREHKLGKLSFLTGVSPLTPNQSQNQHYE